MLFNGRVHAGTSSNLAKCVACQQLASVYCERAATFFVAVASCGCFPSGSNPTLLTAAPSLLVSPGFSSPARTASPISYLLLLQGSL